VEPSKLYEQLVSKGQAYVADDDLDGERPVRFDESATYRVGLGLPGHSRGPEDALVTIVVFSEFECPFSARAAASLAALESDHPGDIRLVYRHLPLRAHVRAHLAAEASVAAARQGKFWEFHDLLYRHEGPRERAVLEWYAERLGLDMGAFRSALDDRRFLDVVSGDTATAYALGIGATPTLVINGRVVRGALPYPRLDAIVVERLKEARALVKQGVPRSEVYATLMRDADIVEMGVPTAGDR
jgi:protein-disulfide isomerase